ncbi:MAG: hypothetical protein NZ942_03745 [Candidatus Aenigmarchaeota archaeon]|nr:hypothetical protein [Candidatus Aenigmarchaeota archaeon]
MKNKELKRIVEELVEKYEVEKIYTHDEDLPIGGLGFMEADDGTVYVTLWYLDYGDETVCAFDPSETWDEKKVIEKVKKSLESEGYTLRLDE